MRRQKAVCCIFLIFIVVSIWLNLYLLSGVFYNSGIKKRFLSESKYYLCNQANLGYGCVNPKHRDTAVKMATSLKTFHEELKLSFEDNRATDKDIQKKVNLWSFRQRLDKPHYQVMLALWKDFTRLCKVMRFPFTLYGGSLLGSYRHHGFIPWDDDLDVLMNLSYHTRIFKQFSKLPGFQIIPVEMDPGFFFYKFFRLPKGAPPTEKYDGVWDFYWPFVDIFFFQENSTHIFDVSWGFSPYNVFAWDKAKFFPLKQRPFEGEMYSVPCDVIYALRQEGKDAEMCISSNYDHIRSKILNSTAVRCRDLENNYPFVRRTVTNDTLITESVVLEGNILKTHTFENDC